MRRRLVNFGRAAHGLLDHTINVTGLRTSGSLSGAGQIDRGETATNLHCSIQPRSAWENDTVLGKYTNATHMLFCAAWDSLRQSLDIRKGYTVTETQYEGHGRKWEVTDDPENYDDVFLAVPIRPVRLG